jgi:nicotinamidase-related amidase
VSLSEVASIRPTTASDDAGTMSLREMVRLATIPAAELLAETRSALLLVDVQNRFIYGASEATPAPTARVLEPVKRLLTAARGHDIPRVFVTVGHPKGADSASWMRRLASMGSDVKRRLDGPLPPWANEIPAAIAPQPGEVHLMKCRFSAFYETGLEFVLRGSGVETVIIGGVASYGCIIATFIDACSRGFFPLLCADAVDGVEPTQHRAAMDFMSPNSTLKVEEIEKIWSRGR